MKEYIKKYIKTLLGITDLENKVSKLPSESDTKVILTKLVRDAFSGDIVLYSRYSECRIWFKNLIEKEIETIFENEIKLRVEQRINEIINDEKILDNLVERIKKKQLN